DEQSAFFTLSHLENGAEVWMIECRSRPRLTDEARLRSRIVSVVRQQKFQRNWSSQTHVLGAIDDPHSACAERLEHTEMRDRLSDETEWIRRDGDRRVERVVERRELGARRRVGG